MKQLSFEFPSEDLIKDALIEEFSVLDGNLKVIQSYFHSASLNSNGDKVISGFVMYEYNEYFDNDFYEVFYMVYGFKETNGKFEFDEFCVGDGFELIDEADEYLKSKFNVKLI